jgi:hypothetical protein
LEFVMRAPSPLLPGNEPLPLGEVSLAPAAHTGIPEDLFARRLADHVATPHPETVSEALKRLRGAFPSSPLAIRVAALRWLMQR